MKKTTVYQLATTGATKVWTVEVVNKGDHSLIVTENGQLNGKLDSTTTIIDSGKGKKTHFEQACSEAQSKLNSKTRKGYVEDLNAVKSSFVFGNDVPAPMLAQKYDPTMKQSGSKSLDKFKIRGQKAVVQPKFDGVRRLIHVDLNGVNMYSRKGDLVNFLPHIADQIHKSFLKVYNYINTKYGVTEYWLDGEAYSDTFTFNTVNGLVRKEMEESVYSQIDLRLYDVMLDCGYETRMKVLNYFASQNVIVTESTFVTLTDEVLAKYHDQFAEAGYEGLMIRQLGMGYDYKRSNQLIKMKLFDDAEFELVGGEESSQKGRLGAFVFKMKTIAYDRNGKLIETFNATPKADHSVMREYWTNLSKYIGTTWTIEFFGYSEYGVPRFSKAKSIRYDI